VKRLERYELSKNDVTKADIDEEERKEINTEESSKEEAKELDVIIEYIISRIERNKEVRGIK